ncbi:hypothetical protein ElyMa_005017300 [Elysia marginata]|uniref:CCHC-type domain-containing protein n=1 Tax=Elysia marginata TaxID=1093978 RepID=A0AAV4JD17_9GAST|nr:hypothetical protein ElyMa_005017300 [Elysia marginata]
MRKCALNYLLSDSLLWDKKIVLKNQNPLVLRSGDGTGKEVPTTRLTVDGLPVSYSKGELEEKLRKLNLNILGSLILDRARDSDGRMTCWLTGRRWLWIEVPKVPLPRTLYLAPFTATLYHREMESLGTSKSCYKYGALGHIARECKQGSLDENKKVTTNSHDNIEERGNESERNAKDSEEERMDSSGEEG